LNEQAVLHGSARRVLDIFKYAPWLTAERVRLWARAFAFAWLFLFAFDLWAHSLLGVTDANGEHMGRDFINYWSASKLAEEGRAPLVYDLQAFHQYQQSLVGNASEWKMYSYPPVLMMFTLPLGRLPFIAGLCLWSSVGVMLGTLIARGQTGWRWSLCLIAALAAPASLWNLIAGQNGYFTAAFLAGGLLMLEARPYVAGIIFGLLIYKPQLGLMIPIALFAGRQWRCFGAAALTAVFLAVSSILLFGINSWIGFIHQMSVQRAIMEVKPWLRMPTVFSTLRVMHVPPDIAYAFQTVSALFAALIVFKIWRGGATFPVRAAALCIAAFLSTPYAWDYDMIVLTFAAIWLAQEGLRTGFLPWEKFTWFVVMLLPTPLMGMAQFMGFQPAALVLWFALYLVLHRAKIVHNVISPPNCECRISSP
jgi:arabinofuranan 3-O-arabinosyltransferase